jgi:transposase
MAVDSVAAGALPAACGCEGCARLARENERLRARVSELEGKVEELRRGAKRQAAPFSRGKPARDPQRPGRRPGGEYGKKAHRPAPEEIDETVEAPLEENCECGGEIEFERVAYQYQEELPEPRPIRRAVKVYIGRCKCCRRRHQGRHPCQTSDAIGAAGSQLGPRAVATVTQLNKELGLSPHKTAKALLQLAGIKLTPGGVVQAVARQARVLEPTYGALIDAVRVSDVVAPDETGWRVGGRKAWLWGYAGDGVTVYQIAHGRGYDDAKVVLGGDFDGVLERDGWAPYRRFEHAWHQTCCAHLLRRCSEMIADSIGGQARVPRTLRGILKDGLALRDARDRGELDDPGLTREIAALEVRIDTLLAGAPTHPANKRLLEHLSNEREHLTTFLRKPGVQATNWRAEQALRPAIVNRKSWGGNRTWTGAHTQEVTTSVIRTARQQHQDPIELMATAQLHRTPAISNRLKLPVTRSAPALAA